MLEAARLRPRRNPRGLWRGGEADVNSPVCVVFGGSGALGREVPRRADARVGRKHRAGRLDRRRQAGAVAGPLRGVQSGAHRDGQGHGERAGAPQHPREHRRARRPGRRPLARASRRSARAVSETLRAQTARPPRRGRERRRLAGRGEHARHGADDRPGRGLVMRQTLGVAAILLYSAHAVVLIHRGEAHDLLWGCHVAVLFVGAGLLASSARLNSIGLLWSCFGMPLWVLYAFTGGEVLATSALTHMGAFVIGTYGVRLLGIPRASAWAASGAFLP